MLAWIISLMTLAMAHRRALAVRTSQSCWVFVNSMLYCTEFLSDALK